MLSSNSCTLPSVTWICMCDYEFVNTMVIIITAKKLSWWTCRVHSAANLNTKFPSKIENRSQLTIKACWVFNKCASIYFRSRRQTLNSTEHAATGLQLKSIDNHLEANWAAGSVEVKLIFPNQSPEMCDPVKFAPNNKREWRSLQFYIFLFPLAGDN